MSEHLRFILLKSLDIFNWHYWTKTPNNNLRNFCHLNKQQTLWQREKKKQRETPDGTTADGFFFQQNGEIWQNSLPDFPCFDIRVLQLSREPVWYSSNVVLSLLCFSVHSDFNELFPPTPPSEKITTWQ